MSDLIRLEHRAAPWQPSVDARLVKQYRYYDVPICGVIAQGGREYIFQCASRLDDSPTIWWYADISAEQRRALEDGPAESFDQRLRGLSIEGWGRLAFATEHLGIVDFEDLELTRKGLQESMDKLLGRLDDLNRHAHEAHPELAFS